MKGPSPGKYVGRRTPRVDGVDKVTGAARFTNDITLPGMLHAAIVPSPFPAGTIERIDLDDALEIEGVYGAIVAEDLGRSPIDCRSHVFGPVVRDQPILAGPEVRFVGEPIAAIYANSARAARSATSLVTATISDRRGVTTLDEALSSGAPLVHGSEPERGDFGTWLKDEVGRGNICATLNEEQGDVDKGMSEAALVFDDSYEFPSVYHYAMEPHCAIAYVNDQGITVWSSAQHPHLVARDLGRMFGYPLSAVRVVATYVGGGFGSKSFTHIEPLAVALSLASGRPVKLSLNVTEAMRVSRRHAARARIRTGVTEDGRILAMDIDLEYDTGAYALTGPLVAGRGCFRALGGYEIPNYRVRSRAVYVNISPAGSYRSIGGPQAAWGVEAQLNHIARELSIDPVEIRRRNVAPIGSSFRERRRAMDADLAKNLDLLVGISDEPDEPALPEGWKTGRGVALGVSDPAARASSSAIVKLAGDGSLTLLVGSSELGQGIRTVAAQIAADTLDIPIDSVRVLQTDTGYGPFDTSTGASRSTTMSGLAVQRACLDLRGQVLDQAAQDRQVDPKLLTIVDGKVLGPQGHEVDISEVVKSHFGAEAGNLIGVGIVTEHEFPGTPPFWEIASGLARIGVDVETGAVTLMSYAGVSDLGRVINPTLAEGQEFGAIVQGIGHSLFEQLIWESGEPLTTSLVDYRVPRFQDIPAIVVDTVEDGNGPGPYGSKGGGEGPIVPVAGAIGGAIEQALGIRLHKLPATPEEVWRLMTERADGAEGSTKPGTPRRNE